ncbi:MAG: LamG-like jellyroll fold domain-containing protein [Planctomycetota bacterium]
MNRFKNSLPAAALMIGAAVTPAYGAIVTDSLTFNWDANTATAATDWQSTSPASDTAGTWGTTGTDPVLSAVISSTSITQAYTFDGIGAVSSPSVLGTNQFSSIAPDASFELWVKPTDLTGGEMLFETGGNGRGLSIALNGSDVVVLMKQAGSSDPSEAVLTQTLSSGDIDDFIQIVVTTDGAASHALYVNSVDEVNPSVVSASSAVTFGDFGGTNIASLGGNSQGGGTQSGAGDIDNDATYGDYSGQIGLIRIYDDVLTASELADNFNATVPEPSSLAVALAGAGYILMRRRKN